MHITQRTMMLVMLAAIAGFCFSSYSITHYLELTATGSTDAACNINATVNCDAVAASAYSTFLGHPIGVWGQGFFTAVAIFAGLILLGQMQYLFWLSILLMMGVAATVVLASLSASLGQVCIICVGVYLSIMIAAIGLYSLRAHIQRPELPILAKSVALSGFCLATGLLWTPAQWFTSTETETIPEMKDFSAPLLSTDNQEIPIYTSKYSGMGEDYRWGRDDAKAVLVEFSDFQCPACQRMSHTLNTLKKEFGDGLLIVYKNYPLDKACHKGMSRSFHAHACLAATLARCAGEYGQFTAMHDKIFAKQSEMSDENLILWAKELGLTDEQVTACTASKALQDKIAADIQLGNTLGVQGTPALFLNGRKVHDTRISSLRAAITAYLQ